MQMTAASISHSAMLVPILYGNNLLADVFANSNTVIWAMLIDLICGLSVFGIAVLMFPLLKKFNESIALWYVGLRLNEWVCLTVSGILLLTIISISKDYAAEQTTTNSVLPTIGKYLLEARGYTKILMLLGFCFSSILFYYLLITSRLVPLFISIWGLVGICLLLAEVIANIFGSSLGGIKIMLPLGLNEIFLGIWLIAKGFNISAIGPDEQETNRQTNLQL